MTAKSGLSAAYDTAKSAELKQRQEKGAFHCYRLFGMRWVTTRNSYNKWVFHGETEQPLRMDDFSARNPTEVEGNRNRLARMHAMRRGLASHLAAQTQTLHQRFCAMRVFARRWTFASIYIRARPEKTAAAMTDLEAAFSQDRTNSNRSQRRVDDKLKLPRP